MVATRAALKLGDWVVTEAGFGADLGAEKFIDIKCRATGLRPDVAVVVVSVRALKYHGGVAVADARREDLTAVEAGMANLRRHLSIVRDVYGLAAVVALNRFPTDTDGEVDLVVRLCAEAGVRAFPATHVRDGGAGAEALARGVVHAVREGRSDMRFVYDDHLSLEKKSEAVATRVYGAAGVVFEPRARRRLEQVEAEGFGHLPICVAKTQASFSTDPSQRGAPSGHTVTVRDVRLAAGAGFVVLLTGDVMTMPGLPREPAAHLIDIDDDGRVTGLS